MKDKLKKCNWDLLPVVLMLAVLPLIVNGRKVAVSICQYAWFPDGDYQYDFFMYAKSILFGVLVIWMLIILIDRVLLRRIQIRYWKYFIPLYLYLILVILSTILSTDRTLSLKGMWQQYESVWILIGYTVTAFFCVQVIDTLNDIKVISGAGVFGAVIQGVIGISQLAGRDFFSAGIGRKMLTAGLDATAREALRYQFSDNTQSSVYMALYNPNYAAVYIILLFPLVLALTIKSKKKIGRIVCAILSIMLLFCLYGSGSETGLLVGGVLIVIAILSVELHRKTTIIKRVTGIILCVVLVVGGIGGYDVAKNHVLSKALKKSTQKHTYNLERISTNENGVTLYYKGKTFELIPKKTKEGQILAAVENGKTRMTAVWDSQQQCFRFKDTVYDKWNYDTYEAQGRQYLILQGKKIRWTFYKADDSDGYVYVNVYGKPDELENAKAVFKGYERALSGRGYIWGRTIPLLKKYFLWGSGPDTFAVVFPQSDYVMKVNTSPRMYKQLPTKAHNMYLQTALQTGVLSLLCLVAFWMKYFILFISNTRKDKGKELLWYRSALAAGLLGFLLMGFMNDSNLAVSPIFWCLLGMGITIELKLKNNAEIK